MTQNDLTSIIEQDVEKALSEDIADGDITAALIPAHHTLEAKLIAREEGLLSGVPWFDKSFHLLDKTTEIEWFYQEGESFNNGDVLAKLKGNARVILTGERTALNFLQMMSGVATKTQRYVKAIKGKAILLDTRKTLPGLRYAQKYAVKCGGGQNHRFGLFDAFLIKENHIKAAGSISQAIQLAKERKKDHKIEVEVETFKELEEALSAKPDIIMLDNFDIESMAQAVSLKKDLEIKLEASGNITLQNIAEVAQTGVNYISTGDITKSVNAIDLSLLTT